MIILYFSGLLANVFCQQQTTHGTKAILISGGPSQLNLQKQNEVLNPVRSNINFNQFHEDAFNNQGDVIERESRFTATFKTDPLAVIDNQQTGETNFNHKHRSQIQEAFEPIVFPPRASTPLNFPPTVSKPFSSGSLETSKDFIAGATEPLNLPSGASENLGNIDTSFSCIDRPYGYYADQRNDCKVFHVCYPALFLDGHSELYHYR